MPCICRAYPALPNTASQTILKCFVPPPLQKSSQLYLAECFQKLGQLPDVFLCVSDFAAINALLALRELGYRVPDDIWLCGFGDTPESSVVTPSLTTIHVHSHIMGTCASSLLLSRMQEPALSCRTIHTETSLIYRESTGDLLKGCAFDE